MNKAPLGVEGDCGWAQLWCAQVKLQCLEYKGRETYPIADAMDLFPGLIIDYY